MKRLDYLVVSGDFADRCSSAGFERAADFLKTLMSQFELTAARLILVPGNHDYDRNFNPYRLELDEKQALRFRMEERVQQGAVYLIRQETEYPKRFERFRSFYKSLTQEDYPEPHEEQGMVMSYPDDGIEFLTLNTAWQIDRFHPERIGVHSGALSKALMKVKPDMKLRLVVWHHAVSGNRQVANQENIQRLTQAGYRLLLHGDVHEERSGLMNHLDHEKRLHVVGTGAYSSPDSGLVAATPRLYNLLEVERDFSTIRVRSRAQRQIDGAFAPFAIYPQEGDPDVLRGDYRIALA